MKEKVDVLVATYNGEKYLREQLDSIIKQTYKNIRILISDDCSKDRTQEILQEYEKKDDRIKIFLHDRNLGSNKNFEFLLRQVESKFYMLSDQDDVWLRNKVEIFLKYLKEYDLVISNHTAVHADLQLYEGYKSKVLIPTLWNTLYRTQFLGCCMAFHRRLLSKILPFPQVPLMHDIWIGLMALKYGRIGIIQEPLLLYRRHGGNASVNLEKKSSNSLTFKILYRFYILKAYLNG